MPLRVLPVVERLVLATIRAVPDWHPEHATFRPFPVHAWVVRHPDGLILVDTGVGPGHPLIDDWYRPEVTTIGDALAAVGVDLADVSAVVLSHLHFDHCGQQASLDAPVYVQAAEHEAAMEDGYTVPEWAAISDGRLRLTEGDLDIAEGVSLIATAGHTPGHQSVLLTAGDARVMIAGQCAFSATELRSGEPAGTNLHDETWAPLARRSLERVHAFAPITCHLSHDPEVVYLHG